MSDESQLKSTTELDLAEKIENVVVVDKDEGGIPYKVKAGAFLAFAGGFGLLAGFGGALAQARQKSCFLGLFVIINFSLRLRNRILVTMIWGQGNQWKERNRRGALKIYIFGEDKSFLLAKSVKRVLNYLSL